MQAPNGVRDRESGRFKKNEFRERNVLVNCIHIYTPCIMKYERK